MDILTLLVAVAALVTAGVALAIVLRDRAVGDAEDASSSRRADREGQIAQLVQRLDVVESEVEARGIGTVAAGGAAGTGLVRRSGASVSHIGVVRFDAFEDAGGAQSFALALLDDGGNGIVLTSLHSRPTTRLYVKSIRGGAADAPLSEEEMRALQEAGLTR